MSYYGGISSNRSRNRGDGYKQHILVGGSKVFVVGSKVLVVGNKFSWEAIGAGEIIGS